MYGQNLEQQILESLDIDVPIIKDNNIKPGEATHLVADSSKLKEILVWEPKISWDEGIENTIKYYVDNQNLYNKATSRV